MGWQTIIALPMLAACSASAPPETKAPTNERVPAWSICPEDGFTSVDDMNNCLDRTSIPSGIWPIIPKLRACGEGSTVNGQVKVHTTVSSEGLVTTATVVTTPDPGLGACVAAVLRTAVFQKRILGGSFTFPIRFPWPARQARLVTP